MVSDSVWIMRYPNTRFAKMRRRRRREATFLQIRMRAIQLPAGAIGVANSLHQQLELSTQQGLTKHLVTNVKNISIPHGPLHVRATHPRPPIRFSTLPCSNRSAYMSTPIQVAANRQNSQQSTGPRTESGKASSSGNSTSHGLSAQPSFSSRMRTTKNSTASLARMRDEFSPQDEHEIFLIDQMIHARWRLARTQRFEGAALELMLEPAGPDQSSRPAHCLQHDAAGGAMCFRSWSATLPQPSALTTGIIAS